MKITTDEISKKVPTVTKAEDWDQRYTNKNYIWTVEPNACLKEQVSDLMPGSKGCSRKRNPARDPGYVCRG